MNFNIKRIDGRSSESSLKVYFLNELENAEKNGFKKIIIKKPQLMEYEDMIGQIFHYKPERYELSEGVKSPLKNIWILTGGKPHTIRKRISGGGTEDEAGELHLEVMEGEYLPRKEKYITDKEVDQVIHERGKGVWKEGRFLINKYGAYGRIKRFQVGEIEDDELSNNRPINNPHQEFIPQDDIQILVSYEKYTRIDVNKPEFDAEKVYSYGKGEFDKFEKEWYIIEDTDLLGYENKVLQAKEMRSLEVFSEQIMIGTSQDEQMQKDMGSDSTALMGTKSQDQLQLMHDNIYRKTNMSKAVQCSFKRVIVLQKEDFEIALEKEREKMDLMKQELEYQITVFEKQMKKIQRLITTLEIYMGESENVVQISEGALAPEDEPISLRQMMLYMDEEFGDPDNGGLDFKNIEEFDKWLVDSGNYEKVIPEQKGVVVLRPRRYDKDYGLHKWFDLDLINELREKNSRFYILIRNGENLYKIWTDKVEFGKRLFPLKSELQGLMDKVAKGQVKMNENERGDYSFRSGEETVEEANDEIFYYQRNFLLLQGIIMRTPIFNPIPKDFNFLDASTHGDTVRFIYDEENSLADGRLRYQEYKAEINSKIVKGSRVLITSYYNVGDYESRFQGYLSDRALYNIESPELGLYNVKARKIDDFSYKTVTMPKGQWEIMEKKHELMKEKYKVVVKGSGAFSGNTVKYSFPSGYSMPYEKSSSWKTSDEEKGLVTLCELNEDGEKIRINNKKEELYISYSYEHEYSRKTVHKTFIIKPTDNQIINYDAIMLEDMDYYISNRIDRHNYAHMMPTFFKLREELREENKAEEHFVRMTKGELLKEYPSLGELDIETMIWDAIEWWKNKKATVWKRPIAKDDSKALEMILQQVKRMCIKKGKKNITTGANYKESLLVWKIKRHTFFAFGVTKKEFAAQVNDIKNTNHFLSGTEGFSKCANEVRGIRNPRTFSELKMMKEAKENKGIVKLLRY